VISTQSPLVCLSLSLSLCLCLSREPIPGLHCKLMKYGHWELTSTFLLKVTEAGTAFWPLVMLKVRDLCSLIWFLLICSVLDKVKGTEIEAVVINYFSLSVSTSFIILNQLLLPHVWN
jgi:hypothetical protein